jgi:hypothetical protein
MKLNHQYGFALIAGTLMAGLTMSVHPTHVDSSTTAATLAHQMQVLVAVHALALLSVPISVFGFVGVTRRLGWDKPEVLLAFIVYSFSAISIVFAAIADGLINAAILPRLLGADPASSQILKAAIEYNHQLNQACAQVYVIGSSLAILLWSVALMKLESLERKI